MDSFICGVCKSTFHKLEEFAEHKQTHGFQTLLKHATSQKDTETLLGSEASCSEVQLPVFCPSVSQMGTASLRSPTASIACLPSFSMAPNDCVTSSISPCNLPVSSPASFSLYVGNSSHIQTSAMNSTKLMQYVPELSEDPKLAPVTETSSSSHSLRYTLESSASTATSLGVSEVCFQTVTSGTNTTSSVESKCAGKMPIPAIFSVQSSNSPVPTASALPPYSVAQISNTETSNQEQVRLVHHSEILRQNMSENELKDIILIEISAAKEKNCELITKVNVAQCELTEGTAGRTASEANGLRDSQCEIRTRASRLQRMEREVTCMISELNEQDCTATQECLSDQYTDAFASTITSSNLSVVMNGIKEHSMEANGSSHCLTGKCQNNVVGGKREGSDRDRSNHGHVYVTEGLLPHKQKALNMDNLVSKGSDQSSIMNNRHNMHANTNVTSEITAEKLYFSEGNNLLSTISVNSDDSKFGNQATDTYAQNDYAKLVSSRGRGVSINEGNGKVIMEGTSGDCGITTEGSNEWNGMGATSSTNETLSRTGGDSSIEFGDRTVSEVTAKTVANVGNVTAEIVRNALEDKSDAEFDDRTAVQVVTQTDVQARHETGTVVIEGNYNGVENSFCLESDETTTKIVNKVLSAANNKRDGECNIRSDSKNQTDITIGDNSEAPAEHIDGPTSETSIRVVAQADCETSLLNDDGIDLVNSSGLVSGTSDVSDLACASAPGLYTLLLNADNTFTLVAGGYQGSSSSQSSQVFVCRHCKKFALSQVEVLNHVSTCHPEDLDNVNQCVLEFSALPSSYSETSDILNDTDQIFRNGVTLNMETASRGSSNSLVAEGCGSSQTVQEEGCDKLEMHKRTIRRKLGRPRKQDMVNTEDQNKEPKENKRFKMEGHNIVCLDCRKIFLKQRQFDKHRCRMWQLSLEQLSCAQVNSHIVPQISEGKMQECFSVGESNRDMNFDLPHENLFEGELEEEWKGNRIYTAKVKIKHSEGERRKRGRPPKVDTLTFGVGSNEGQSEEQVEGEAEDERDKYSRNGDVNSWQGHRTLQKTDTSPLISSIDTDSTGLPRASAELPLLQSIPTLPLFSNPKQQERLHKWIAQIDLSFVDSIINKIYPGGKTPEKQSVAMYVCQECKVLFRTLLSCRRHCAKHMSKKAFTCPDCDFATTNVGALYSHYRNHTQNLYACDKCDFRARIKAHYRDHLETHNPSRHICRLCQRPYSTSNSLRSHIYLNHRNEEGMKYIWSLRRKNQAQNKQDFVFQCPICNRLFNEQLLANKHLASHSSHIPKAAVKCEVCRIELLHRATLKRHFQKHKVIYICCVCFEPQITASGLRRHLREGSCSSSQGDTFKLSFLYSYTLPETFPSLFSNKRLGLGPSFLELIKHQDGYKLPVSKVSSNLLKQMQDTGYRQIYELLQDRHLAAPDRNTTSETSEEIMKIVVDTRYIGEKEQIMSREQRQASQEHEQVYHQSPDSETGQGEGGHNASDHYLETRFPTNQHQDHEDLTVEESDQRVVVISNVGEEQTVVVEEGQMVVMDEERFVIIHEESEGRPPSKLDSFLTHVT